VAASQGTRVADGGVPDDLQGIAPPDGRLPETFGYTLKRKLLGPPLVNEQIAEEKLSRPLAIGVLSCDGISSAAYGTEEMLIEMIPIVGLAAFTLILPMTLVILVGIVLVVLSYREVVSVYTRAGGSYVVARENFGPRVAQVAAVALLIDYTVTVAVQTAAGSAAIVSAFPQMANIPVIGPYILIVISVLAVVIMCYGNLRGIREAGRTFALPTYLFSGSVGLMIIVGLVREVVGSGLPHVTTQAGTYPIGHSTQALLSIGMIYMLARSFANGGSSLTGIEAVSNAVSALRPPEGRNARQILVTQGSIVAFLIAGISWLSHVTHAIPYIAGYPTVLAQEANVVFGSSGHFMYFVVQAATALILFTGGNTSFSGFPFLASFVAGDSFLPREVPQAGQGKRLEAAPGDQPHGGHLHRDRGGDLRDREVHRGRLGDRHRLPAPGVPAHPAQPGVPDGGRGPGEHRGPAGGGDRATAAELQPPRGADLRGQRGPRDVRCHPVCPRPAADLD